MGWLSKLEELAGDAYRTGVAPLLHGAKEGLDWSSEHGKEWAGDAKYYGTIAFPDKFLDMTPGANSQEIRDAHKAGGGRAVWEKNQGDLPLALNIFNEATNPFDLVNLVGYLAAIGPLRAAVKGLPEMGKAIQMAEKAGASKQAIGKAIEVAGKGIWGTVRATELPGEKIAQGVGFGLNKTIGKAIKPNSKTLYTRAKGAMFNAWAEHTAAEKAGSLLPPAPVKTTPVFTKASRSQIADEITSNVNGPDSGGTWSFGGSQSPTNQSGLTPWKSDTGYMISVGDNKIKLNDPMASSKIKQAISRYEGIFSSRHAEDLKVGAYKMNNGDEFSVDFSLWMPDEDEALALANALNQESIYNMATGETIMTGLKGLAVGRSPLRTSKSVLMHLDKIRPEIINTASPRFNESLSDIANSTMSEKVGSGKYYGDTKGAALLSIRDKFASGLDSIEDMGVTFTPEMNLDAKLSLVKGDKDATYVVREFDRLGLDPMVADANGAAYTAMAKELSKEFGVDPGEMTKYDIVKGIWGEQALVSGRYHASNFLGNWMAQVVGGGKVGIPARNVWRAVRAEWGRQAHGINIEDAKLLKSHQVMEDAGLVNPSAGIERSNATQGLIQRVDDGKSITARVLGPRFGVAGKALGKIADYNNSFATGIELGWRDSMWSDVFKMNLDDSYVKLQPILDEAARKSGIDLTNKLNLVSKQGMGDMTAPAFKRQLTDLGIKEGQAEHVVREFVNMRKTSMDGALKEINRFFFSYERTNLDDFVSKFVPFHYWASRATRFYAENTIRHPIWIVNYARMTEGMDHLAEDPGLNGRSKGFIKLLNSPAGFTLMMNPMALIGIAKYFQMDTNFTPDGETELGRIMRFGKQRGIGLFPWMDATFNYMGVYGDTFEPDPAGVRIRALVGAGVQMMAAEAGQPPPIAPYAAVNSKLRAWVSDLTASVAPDWLSQPVAQKSSRDGTLATATLDDLISSRIMAENPEMTNGELLAILSDPDSPEYSSAYKDVAASGLVRELLNFTAPTTFKSREISRDVARAQLGTIRKYAELAGDQTPWDFRPKVGDLEFAVEYERQTGSKWNPKDFDKAQMKRDLAVAPPGSKEFIVQEAEYRTLGTPAMQDLNNKLTSIRKGDWLPPGFEHVTLDENQRDMVANAYAAKHDTNRDLPKLRTLQHAYRQMHTGFDQFKNWESQMYNIEAAYGTLAVYRDQVIKHNPNAARYFQDVIAEIKVRMKGQSTEKMIEELDRKTISSSTWYAVTGQSDSQFKPLALSTGGLPFGQSIADVPLPAIPKPSTPWMDTLRERTQ